MGRELLLALLIGTVLLSPQVMAQDECYNCHIEQSDSILRNPAEVVANGEHANLKCKDCHYFDLPLEESESYLNDHEGVPRKLSPSENIDACALRCHETSLPFRHGQEKKVELDSVIEDEDLTVICTSCHESHDTRGSNDQDSWIYRVNIPRTCAGRDGDPCHDRQKVGFYDILNKYSGYLESGHGRMQALGYEKAAVCSDCHGVNGTSHTRIVNKENPESPINPVNREATCTQEGCHIGSGVKVFPGSMHGMPEYQILEFTLEGIIDTFYKMVILIFVGGAGLFILLDLSRRLGGGR
jgi:hypothetical protein